MAFIANLFSRGLEINYNLIKYNTSKLEDQVKVIETLVKNGSVEQAKVMKSEIEHVYSAFQSAFTSGLATKSNSDDQKLRSIRSRLDALFNNETTHAVALRERVHVIVRCDAGLGNSLELRGNGINMTWQSGIRLDCKAADRWEADMDIQRGVSFDYKVVLKTQNAEIFEIVGNDAMKNRTFSGNPQELKNIVPKFS